MRLFLKRTFVVLFALLDASRLSRAGSDVAPLGKGELIETLAFSSSSIYFDERGSSRSMPLRGASELSSYLEWGAAKGVALVASSAAERIKTQGEQTRTGLEPTALGARFALFDTPLASLAFQVSALAPAAPAALSRAILSGTHPGADVRLLAFRDFQLFGTPAFAEIQAGQRATGFQGVSETHADFTVGVKPTQRWLVLVQGFGTIARAPSAAVALVGRPAYEKLEISAVYEISAEWSAQVGYVATAVARDARRDRGAILALWRRF